MSALDRKAARSRCDAATEGPWRMNDYYHCVQTQSNAVKLASVVRFGNVGERLPLDNYFDAPRDHPEIANATFIAHAREDLPAALDLLDRCLDALEQATFGRYDGTCIECGERGLALHADDCELHALLQDLSGPTAG